MKSISLYENQETFVHHLEPLSKLFYIICALLIPVICGSRWVWLGCILMSLGLLWMGKVLRKTLPILGCSFLIILTVFLIQGLFRAENVTPFIKLGKIVFYREGLFFALGVGLNVLNLLLAFSVLILTTKPSDLVEALVRIGLSPKLGYVLSSVFQIIPQMSSTMETITDAQRSRGMETEGKLLVRLKAFIPLIAPVVMNSLINTRERAIALEVRGFNSNQPKSYINVHPKSKMDHIVKVILGILLVSSIIGRFFVWQHLL